MDENKTGKLREIEYTIRKTCNNCRYSFFIGDNWGVCKKHTYYHLKHKEIRKLSINRYGYCKDWEEMPYLDFGLFEEFFDKS